jgi:DNA invertase Pin-like site-specific DNA recombinase
MAAKRYKGYRQAQRPFSPAEEKTIRTMREKGATGAEIAQKLHVHKGAVHRRLREIGLSYTGFWSALRAENAKPKKRATAKKAKKK